MKITVIVCTHNRCQSLAKTLKDVAASRLADSVEWEVLVIDNSSTDHTREVVENLCCLYPFRFRYLFEPQQGKSYALNTGVREARGDVLVFIDDDVAVEPTWVHNLTAALEDRKWAGVGGKTLLAGSFLPPGWMTMEGRDSMGGALAPLFDLGPDPCELNRPPYGTNMAFRREMFERYGLFRTDLGPSPDPDIPRPNEDTEFGRRLMAAGEKLYYEPSAIVHHPIVDTRIQKSHFLAWYFDYGRAMVREWGCGPDILGISRRCFTLIRFIGATFPGEILRWMITLNPRRRFFRKCRVRATAGQIVEIYRQWRRAMGRSRCSTQGSGEPAVPQYSRVVVTSRASSENIEV